MKIHTLDLGFLDLADAIAVFVVEGPSGLALVETGPASTLPHLQTALAKNGWQIADFQHVFLTHIHFDHAGAAWAFAEKGATIYVHPLGLPHLAAPEKLYNSARMIYGDAMDRLWGPMHPIPVEQLYAPAHGEAIEAVGLVFKTWHTPGHASHHIAWEAVSADWMDLVVFTGDVAGVRINAGPVMPPCPPPDINIEDWQNSLDLLRKIPSETLYLTHFGAVTAKLTHLDALEEQLLAWAEWMRPYAEAAVPAVDIVPAFQAFVDSEMAARGVSGEVRQRYEAANPAFMSVAGLLRYWNKKNRIPNN